MKIWLIPILAVFLMLTGCQKTPAQLEQERWIAMATIREQGRQQELERQARMERESEKAQLSAKNTQHFYTVLGTVTKVIALAIAIAVCVKLGLRFHAHQLEARRRQERFKVAAQAFTRIAHKLPEDQRESLLTKLLADARAGENLALTMN